MKVNFNQPFTDPFGEPIKENNKPVLIGRTLGLTLFNLGELCKTPMSQEQKYLAYTLSIKIANAEGEVDITAEEADLIDKVAGSFYKAGAYGTIKSILKG